MKQKLIVGALLLLVPTAGWAGEGLVALNTCEASCPDDSSDRYVDCENGTVTDNDTGLVWLANANCLGELTWHEAIDAVAGLSDLPDDGEACNSLTPDQCDCGLSDGSSPGEWRLPSIEEWEAMVKHAADMLGCTLPTITSDAGTECWDQDCVDAGACSFYGVQSSSWYWSSSSSVPVPSNAWIVRLNFGFVTTHGKGDTYHYVWARSRRPVTGP